MKYLLSQKTKSLNFLLMECIFVLNREFKDDDWTQEEVAVILISIHWLINSLLEERKEISTSYLCFNTPLLHSVKLFSCLNL